MNRMEEIRVKKGYTRREISVLTSISEYNIYKIERKGQVVKVDNALAIAKVLGTSVEELFGE